MVTSNPHPHVVKDHYLKLLGKAHLKKTAHIWPSGPTGGGEVCQNTNLLNRFFCDIIELYELQNKVSIQNMLCFFV